MTFASKIFTIYTFSSIISFPIALAKCFLKISSSYFKLAFAIIKYICLSLKFLLSLSISIKSVSVFLYDLIFMSGTIT
jgi:hypothetical protein